jgi:hypothetical protein
MHWKFVIFLEMFQAFNMESKIGAGCFGDVYRVRSKADGQLFAVGIQYSGGIRSHDPHFQFPLWQADTLPLDHAARLGRQFLYLGWSFSWNTFDESHTFDESVTSLYHFSL